MESRAISFHQITVCDFAVRRKGWFTARDVVNKTSMKLRTVQLHLKRLTEVGILERRKAFGGCRYRQRGDEMDPRAEDYLKRLREIYESAPRKRRLITTTLSSLAMMFV